MSNGFPHIPSFEGLVEEDTRIVHVQLIGVSMFSHRLTIDEAREIYHAAMTLDNGSVVIHPLAQHADGTYYSTAAIIIVSQQIGYVRIQENHPRT